MVPNDGGTQNMSKRKRVAESFMGHVIMPDSSERGGWYCAGTFGVLRSGTKAEMRDLVRKESGLPFLEQMKKTAEFVRNGYSAT